MISKSIGQVEVGAALGTFQLSTPSELILGPTVDQRSLGFLSEVIWPNKNSARCLQFESLTSRLCFALGDIDLGFGQSGEYSTSHWLASNTSDRIIDSFSIDSGRLFVAESTAGSGPAIKLFKTDAAGQLDAFFGGHGQVSLVDRLAAPLSVVEAARLDDDTFIALSLNSTSGLATVVAFDSQGVLKNDFGEVGWLRLPVMRHQSQSQIEPDGRGGFLVLTPVDFGMHLFRYDEYGRLDTSFGSDGVVATVHLVNPALRVLPNGSIALAALQYGQDVPRMSLRRWLPDGRPDTNFGTNGASLSQNVVPWGHPVLAMDGNSIFMYVIGPRTVEADRYQVLKFSANVELDPSYGANGLVNVDYPPASGRTSYHELQVDAQERVYFSVGTAANPSQRLVNTVARLTARGLLDTSFGTDGISHTTFDNLSLEGYVQHQQLTSDGMLWVGLAFPSSAGSGSDAFVLRMREDGSYDNSWGSGGLLQVDLTRAARTINMLRLVQRQNGDMQVVSGWPAIENGLPTSGKIQTLDDSGQSIDTAALKRTNFHEPAYAPSLDGGWYVAQLSWKQQNIVAITKYSSRGLLDTTFGTGGTLTVPSGMMRSVMMRTVADGSVMVVAEAWTDHATEGNSVLMVARIGTDNKLDTSFGTEGILRLSEKPGTLVDVLDGGPTGTFIVYANAYAHQIDIQRLDAVGKIVESYGNQGLATLSRVSIFRDAAVDELGRVLVLSSDYSNTTTQWLSVHRLGVDGQPDKTFGEGSALILTRTQSILFDSTSLVVEKGMIAAALTTGFEQPKVRLVAVDYSGKPLEELGPGGMRDYELAAYGEEVTDLAFADDGAIWMAYTARTEHELIGKVIRLEGSAAPSQHNWDRPTDVNSDSNTTAMDALLIINILNGGVSHKGILADVNADSYVTALDALLVINQLNSQTLQPEGETKSLSLARPGSQSQLWHLCDLDLGRIAKRKQAIADTDQ